MNSVLFIEQDPETWEIIEIDDEDYEGYGWSILFVSELSLVRRIIEFLRYKSIVTLNLIKVGRIGS